jgi:4-amino-4-deoxy-L-arabinose transferase-like glycosyltransferase
VEETVDGSGAVEARPIKLTTSSWNTYIVLGLIVAAGFAARLYGVADLPYNYDEPKNIEIVDSIDPARLALPARSFQHPPLSVYVFRVGVAVFGSNNLGYRSMNALAGALSILGIYALAQRGFGDERVGLLAALFLATNRFHIGWSRQVNQEVIYLGLVILSLIAFWNAMRRDSGWAAFGVALALAVLAKELALLLVPALLLGLLCDSAGRGVLRRSRVWIALAGVAVVAGMLLAYALRNPGRHEMNVAQNLHRATSIGISVEPLEFFLSPSTTHDAPLADSWSYPSMHWLTGVVLLAGVAASIPNHRESFTRLMLLVFGFYVLLFTLVGADPSGKSLHQGEFWWVDVAIVPAIVLTSRVVIHLKDRGRVFRAAFWALPLWLVADAAFFVAITPGGPILRMLGMTYNDVVARVPFLL